MQVFFVNSCFIYKHLFMQIDRYDARNAPRNRTKEQFQGKRGCELQRSADKRKEQKAEEDWKKPDDRAFYQPSAVPQPHDTAQQDCRRFDDLIDGCDDGGRQGRQADDKSKHQYRRQTEKYGNDDGFYKL